MTSTIHALRALRWPGLILVLLSGLLLVYLSGQWSTALVWWSGFVLLSTAIRRIDAPQFGRIPVWAVALLAAAVPTFLLLFIQGQTRPDMAWHGFLHVADVRIPGWLNVLCLWSPAMGLWLWSYVLIGDLQVKMPEQSRRLLHLVGAAVVINGLALIFPFSGGFISMMLVTVVFLVMLDLYRESERTTSLTWLLSWLLLFSLFLSAYSFQRGIRNDLLIEQEITERVLRQDYPDSSMRYPMAYQWDTIGQMRADSLLPPDILAMEPGEKRALLTKEGIDWVQRSSDGQLWVISGRPSGGYRPPLLLSSLFFITGLGLTFALRGICWLLGFPLDRWPLPLYGPSSLRIRIQLYFFGLALIIFLLVSWFTYIFFRDQGISLQDWLDNLLGLYAFLLIVAAALGIFLANSITEPIVQIGQKLGDTRLRDNEPLDWPRQDEIGRLVANYNQMIVALDESARRLATSERESAWREMAKQVAHEIKNPLTPMKLQLQQLRRLQKEDPERAAEYGQRVSQSLIEQIDGLARIAGEFSHFARLPEAREEVMDVRELLRSVHQLFRHNTQGGDVRLELPEEALSVRADRDQLTRVLNNLLRNALQALPSEGDGRILLKAYRRDERMIIEVQDNGSGISEELRERIFEPQFTTKSSGMGLGLAMCKNMVEQAGGCLSFQSAVGEGTTFSVTLPHFQDLS